MEKIGLNFLGDSKKGIGPHQIKYCCPFCDDDSYHLGVHLIKKVYHCFHCGAKGKIKGLIPKIDDFDQKVKSYFKGESHVVETGGQPLLLPNGFELITSNSGLPFRYLKRRGITLKEIRRYRIGYCSEGIYQERIILPVYDDFKLKYYIGRSYTNRKPKYMNVMIEKRNTIFYSWDSPKKKVVVVEGIFDAIQVGKVFPAIAILGKEINLYQVTEICKHVEEAIILLDPDAKRYGLLIMNKLNYHIKVKVKFLERGDPGSTSVEELKEVLK